MIRRTFTYRRFQIIAALSVGLFLTVASALPGPLEAQTTGTATLTVHVTDARNACSRNTNSRRWLFVCPNSRSYGGLR